MSTFSERLRDERKRLGFNQTELAALAGVQKGAQVNYEAGERSPNADYLIAIAAAGADVLYILTGQREGPAPVVLNAEEQILLDYFRDASKELRKAALGVLLSGTMAPVGNVTQNFGGMSNNTPGGVQVGYAGGNVRVKKGS